MYFIQYYHSGGDMPYNNDKLEGITITTVNL